MAAQEESQGDVGRPYRGHRHQRLNRRANVGTAQEDMREAEDGRNSILSGRRTAGIQ